MKQATLTILACAIFSLFFSCGKTYTTPFKNDPFFTQEPLETDILREYGEGFAQRGDYLSNVLGLQPEKGESYEKFENRLVNTLVVQEYDLDSYKGLIGDHKENIQNLTSQLKQLEEQNLDLRMQYQSLKEEKPKKRYEQGAFQPYRVQKNDTLQKISKKFFGTHTAWLSLYQFNQYYIQNPNMIKVGELLWIPSFVSF